MISPRSPPGLNCTGEDHFLNKISFFHSFLISPISRFTVMSRVILKGRMRARLFLSAAVRMEIENALSLWPALKGRSRRYGMFIRRMSEKYVDGHVCAYASIV